MATEFNFDSEKLRKLRKKFAGLDSKLFNRKALLYATIRQKQRMIFRTENGNDVNGNPFKPYSLQYAKKKGKLDVNRVNLTDEAEMLNSITQTASTKEGRVFFNPVVRDGVTTEEIANYHNSLGAGRNKVIRQFFGIGETEGQKIFEDYQKGIRKGLDKEGFK